MLDKLKENRIVNNSQFCNTSVIHVFIYTVDLPQVFCVFMFFCRIPGLELLVFILDKNLIELDVQKIRQRFPLELMRLFTPDYSPVVYRIREEL